MSNLQKVHALFSLLYLVAFVALVVGLLSVNVPWWIPVLIFTHYFFGAGVNYAKGLLNEDEFYEKAKRVQVQ